jgi:hypothetical protein
MIANIQDGCFETVCDKYPISLAKIDKNYLLLVRLNFLKLRMVSTE